MSEFWDKLKASRKAAKKKAKKKRPDVGYKSFSDGKSEPTQDEADELKARAKALLIARLGFDPDLEKE